MISLRTSNNKKTGAIRFQTLHDLILFVITELTNEWMSTSFLISTFKLLFRLFLNSFLHFNAKVFFKVNQVGLLSFSNIPIKITFFILKTFESVININNKAFYVQFPCNLIKSPSFYFYTRIEKARLIFWKYIFIIRNLIQDRTFYIHFKER